MTRSVMTEKDYLMTFRPSCRAVIADVVDTTMSELKYKNNKEH